MTPRFFFQRTRVLWTAMLVGSLAGCSNIKNDSTRTRTEGAVTGAAVGAVAGAVAANALKFTPGVGAVAGVVVGGLAGAAYGNAVAKKKEAYVARESALDAQISGLKQQVANRREYNQKLADLLHDKQKQLATILASDRSAGPTVQEFDLRTSIDTKLREIDQASRSWQETIDAHKAVLQKAKDDPHSADLQTAITQLADQRAELLRRRATLAALPDKLKPSGKPSP